MPRSQLFVSTKCRKFNNRQGVLAVLTAVLMVPLIGMLAFSIDVGYLLKKRAELQRAADAAALAAVIDLVPAPDGTQDLDKVRATVRSYAASNVQDVSGFSVLDADITIGRYDPATVYSNFTILDTGIYDTVRVTLRRDESANTPIRLLFGGIFGLVNSGVSATGTAVLQKAAIVRPGAGVLPFSVPETEWIETPHGTIWSIYGDGRMLNGNQLVAGNWGTLDLGTTTNSTSDINDQILNGLQQVHLDDLYADGRIPNTEELHSREEFWANGDTGLSGGMRHSLEEILGQVRLVPLFDTAVGLGGNLEFHITGWGVAVVEAARFKGYNNTYVDIRKAYTYDGSLRANPDLSETTEVIEGAFTQPVLVE